MGYLDTKPALSTYDNKLFCVWMSAAPYTHGTDMDIYYRYTTTGDFSELGQNGEVTDSNNNHYDHSPNLVGFNNRIFLKVSML